MEASIETKVDIGRYVFKSSKVQNAQKAALILGLKDYTFSRFE